MRYIILFFSFFLFSCSPKIEGTIVEVLYEYNDTHNLSHVVNDKHNYSEVIPTRKGLRADDKVKVNKPKDERQ